MGKLVLSVRDAMEETGSSRPTIYRWTSLPDFPVIRSGKRILIPRKEFEEWLSAHIGKNVLPDGVNGSGKTV